MKVCAFDVPPPKTGLTTVTDALPAAATSPAKTVAVSCVDETYVVARADPFQYTMEVETNPVPFTVRVKEPEPATADVGESAVVVGVGFRTVNVCAVEVPPPGVGVKIVTENVPDVEKLAAGIVAVA